MLHAMHLVCLLRMLPKYLIRCLYVCVDNFKYEIITRVFLGCVIRHNNMLYDQKKILQKQYS